MLTSVPLKPQPACSLIKHSWLVRERESGAARLLVERSESVVEDTPHGR